MLRLIVLGVLVFSGVSFAESRSEAYRACETYTQKNHQLGCSDDNYLQSFGRKYCDRFVTHEEKFSPRGQVVLEKIRGCLQDSIVENPQLTCENAKQIGNASHLRCYVDSGFCSLKFGDLVHLFKVVGGQAVKPKYFFESFKFRSACHENKRLHPHEAEELDAEAAAR